MKPAVAKDPSRAMQVKTARRMQKLYGAFPVPPTANAHDVRHLTVCPHCGVLWDNRVMVRGLHGHCYIDRNGVDALLSLPAAEVGVLTLGDVGPLARRLIRRLAS